MEDLENIKQVLLTEQVENQLFQYILSQPIPLGTKLPNEFKLGERFGVGRSTIREAVKALVSKGILEIRRGAGTFVVSTVRPEQDPLGLLKTEDKMGLAMDLADVRMLLEPAIAEQAALHATCEDVEKLYILLDKIEEKIENGESYVQEDIAFHTFVAECSKNRVMRQLIPIIDTTVMMFVNVTHEKLTRETMETHRQVAEAIARKDFLGARAAMTMHMAYNRELIIKLRKDI